MGSAGELKRPSVTGPLKELNDALHSLHLSAGRPSLSEMERETEGTISRSRLHDAFTAPKLPRWLVVDALVEILASRARGTDPQTELDRFHQLWQRAALAGIGSPPALQSSSRGAEGLSDVQQPAVPPGVDYWAARDSEAFFYPCLPVYLVLDTSYSMVSVTSELNEDLHRLVEYMKNRGLVAGLVSFSIISFGSDTHVVQPLLEVPNIDRMSMLEPNGTTNTAKMFRVLRSQLKADFAITPRGRRWLRPLVFIITDGVPADEGWEDSFSDLVETSNPLSPHVIAFGIGGVSGQVIRKMSTLAAYLATEGSGLRNSLGSAFNCIASIIDLTATERGNPHLPQQLHGFEWIPPGSPDIYIDIV